MKTGEIVNHSILISTLKRSKVESAIVKPFTEFSDEIKKVIKELIFLEENEKEAILSYSNNNKWLLLTSSRIIVKDGCNWISYFYTDITKAEIYRKNDENKNAYSYKREGSKILIIANSNEVLLDIGDVGAIQFPLEHAISWAILESKRNQ
jgi:hypothetical protein